MRRLALLVLVGAFGVTLLPGPWGDERVSDLFLYRGYADLFLGGTLPFRDAAFEYPPLAAPLIALPGLAGTGEEAYRLSFALLSLALMGALVLLVGALAARTGGDVRRALLAAALAPLATGAMLRTHFDLAPVVLTLGSLLLLCARRPRLGLALLGLGVMTKGFPLVVAPVALAWLVARGERRAAAEAAAALGLVILAVGGATLALSPSGALDAVGYHLERPVQTESSPATVLLGLDALGAGTAESVHSHRSDGLEHPAAGVVAGAFLVVLLALLGLLTRAVWRGGPDPPDARVLVLASLAAVTAFAALGKVLSPQFLVWVVPLAALAFAWSRPLLAGAAGGAVVLTLVEFPAHYADVVARDAAALWLVAARNALLILAMALAAAGVLSRARLPARGPARSTSPGRPRRPRPAPR